MELRPTFMLILGIGVLGSSCVSKPIQPLPVGQISNVTSSFVLDGGSYTVDLYFQAHAVPLRLFIPNPQRQPEAHTIVQVLDSRDNVVNVIRPGSPDAKQLHRELITAIELSGSDFDAVSHYSMLDKLITHGDILWEDVSFLEKWK